MIGMLFALVRALLAVLVATQAPAPVHPAPAPHPVHRPAPATQAAALATLVRLVHAHGGRVVATGTYGYGPQGQHTALNGGVWVQVGPGRCVGQELYGHPGPFGNVYGRTGGDCS